MGGVYMKRRLKVKTIVSLIIVGFILYDSIFNNMYLLTKFSNKFGEVATNFGQKLGKLLADTIINK
jgi:hypothetical protein